MKKWHIVVASLAVGTLFACGSVSSKGDAGENVNKVVNQIPSASPSHSLAPVETLKPPKATQSARPTAKVTVKPTVMATVKPTRKPTATPSPKPTVKPTPTPTTEYYANCTDLRKVHPSGVPKGHPAYRAALDRDHDNWACES
jgi:outer membrane biosynthesis protein TonB